MTSCIAESRYLLEHAIRTRGMAVDVNGSSFDVHCVHGRFRLTFLPGNRRVLISHKVSIDADCRGKGYGRKALNLREELAREAGCNLLLATVRNDNEVENHLLESTGWKRLTNRADTGVSLWGKEL